MYGLAEALRSQFTNLRRALLPLRVSVLNVPTCKQRALWNYSARTTARLCAVIVSFTAICRTYLWRAAHPYLRTTAPSTPSWQLSCEPRYYYATRRDTYRLEAHALPYMVMLSDSAISSDDRYNEDFIATITCTYATNTNLTVFFATRAHVNDIPQIQCKI